MDARFNLISRPGRRACAFLDPARPFLFVGEGEPLEALAD
jgi:hypothetical protein